MEICRYPWERIYTTNYDNAIELSLERGGKNFKYINNLEDVGQLDSGKTNIVHLHGFIDSWTVGNFVDSCILTSESYYNLSQVRK